MEDVDEGIEEEENEDEMVVIPLPNVESSTLQLVIMFLEMHNEEPMAEIERPLKKPIEEIVSPEDAAFIDVELPVLFRLILAANYMDIKELLDLSCAKVLHPSDVLVFFFFLPLPFFPIFCAGLFHI